VLKSIKFCQNPSTSGRRRRIWLDSGRIWPDSEFGWNLANLARFWPIQLKTGRIWPDSGHTVRVRSESGQCSRILASTAEIGQMLANLAEIRPQRPDIARFIFSPLVIFSCKSNAGKYFWKNHFSWKMILSKIFYHENHFTSKQTKYKWKKLVIFLFLILVVSHIIFF